MGSQRRAASLSPAHDEAPTRSRSGAGEWGRAGQNPRRAVRGLSEPAPISWRPRMSRHGFDSWMSVGALAGAARNTNRCPHAR